MNKLFILKNKKLFFIILILLSPLSIFASSNIFIPSILGIRVEFILFILTLISVAIFHKQTMYIALIGLTFVLLFKFIFITDFTIINHFFGSENNEGEWSILLNLLGLLFGFSILSKHFEDSKFPKLLLDFLPNDWKGGFLLLFFILILSSFLDNIAAAMIGGTIAFVVYKGRVHLGFLAAIIAASNAGGAGSVIGDTTTTLMWIDGVSPLEVTHAFIGSFVALIIFGFFAAKQQHKYQPIQAYSDKNIDVDWVKIVVVFLILVFAILANWILDFPAIGVWVGILLGALITKTPWKEIKNAFSGTVFLMALVTMASLMPVEELPAASVWTAFALGFVSAVFDNIPLTKLCLEQGGYDWGVLAFSVGFGGSMLWFGSSAGVALSNIYPEIKNTLSYIRKCWYVSVAYIIGFVAIIGIAGWHPKEINKKNKIELEKTKITQPIELSV